MQKVYTILNATNMPHIKPTNALLHTVIIENSFKAAVVTVAEIFSEDVCAKFNFPR